MGKGAGEVALYKKPESQADVKERRRSSCPWAIAKWIYDITEMELYYWEQEIDEWNAFVQNVDEYDRPVYRGSVSIEWKQIFRATFRFCKKTVNGGLSFQWDSMFCEKFLLSLGKQREIYSTCHICILKWKRTRYMLYRSFWKLHNCQWLLRHHCLAENDMIFFESIVGALTTWVGLKELRSPKGGIRAYRSCIRWKIISFVCFQPHSPVLNRNTQCYWSCNELSTSWFQWHHCLRWLRTDAYLGVKINELLGR